MARKRMIDPHFWESAQDKGWKANDCIVMVAAITASDDEGRGRISVIENSIKGIISPGKLKKSLEILRESIIIYRKIYFFLPNFSEYNKPSHPIPSKIPKPTDLEIKAYLENTPELFANDSTTVKVSKGKDRLDKYSKGKGNYVDNSVNNSLPTNEPDLLFSNHSSFTFYEDCLPFDFSDTDAIRNSITKLINKFCIGIIPTKSEITRILNIVTETRGAKPETCFKITAETLLGFNSLPLEKKNFAYLSQTIKGKIDDALIKAIEEKAAKLKENELKEIEIFNKNNVKSLVSELTNKFTIK